MVAESCQPEFRDSACELSDILRQWGIIRVILKRLFLTGFDFFWCGLGGSGDDGMATFI